MRLKSLFWISLFTLNAFISKAQIEVTPAILLNVGDERVEMEEFWRVYTKNNTKAQAIDPKSLEEYLDLFINFKLKVLEAEAIGYDTIQALKNELSGYRKQLAAPYLTDQDVTENLILEAYTRMSQDVRAMHILLRVDEDAEPADTLRAYRKLMGIREKIKNEADFQKFARLFSEDPSAKENGGDLGYFSVFRMVYPFESAAYNTEVGEISMPVRSSFGYHIIYVKDKRKARGEMRAAHIMVTSKASDDEAKKAQAKQKISEIYERLKAGESFEDLAAQFSDDKGSSTKGGDLGWFETGRMVESFEDAAFTLENNGDYSMPVQTSYGWHIIKRLDRKGVPNMDAIQSELKRKVTRDGRGEKSKESFVNARKMEYAYSDNRKNLQPFYKLIDEDYFDRKWKADEKVQGLTKVLFSIEDNKFKKEKKVFTQADFAKYLESSRRFQRRPATPIKQVVNESFEDWVSVVITDFEDQRLELKYKDFADLMKEYRDGILLFELMNDKIWSAAVTDSSGLNAFYEANKQNFMWPERLHASIFTCEDEKIAGKLAKMAKKQLKKGFDGQLILDKFNVESQLTVSVKSDKYEKGKNEFLDKLPWQKGVSTIQSGDKFNIVVMKEVLEPQPKLLSEARGMITAAYQDHLEKEWLKELRKKYPVNVSQPALKTLKKRETK